MYLSRFTDYYKIGRFVFAVTLLLTFHVAGFFSSSTYLLTIVIVYCLICFVRLFFVKKIDNYDFLLDIFFITFIVSSNFQDYSYFTLLYLFPLFFASISLSTGQIFVFPFISIILYGLVFYKNTSFFKTDYILNISLHCLAFSLITFSGNKLKIKMQSQEKRIMELEASKLRMQGYERLYRISADLAHELRNPLTSISSSVQFLQEGRIDKEIIEIIAAETKRLLDLVNDFLFFSKPSDAVKEKVDLSEVLNTVVRYAGINKNILLNIKKNAFIFANRTFLEIAINNIVKNAIEAANSIVKISLNEYYPSKNSFSDDIKYVIVDIEDDGKGIDNDIKNKIFEPFFSTKKDGTGLGLAIAHRVITDFQGDIFVDKSDMGGAKFSLILPIFYLG
jgi:signal transduction histidine kinase